MEPSTETKQKTLAKAKRQAAVTQLTKGTHRLEKGMTRFVSRNGRIVGAVTLGGVTLLATSRLAMRPRRRAMLRLLPRIGARLAMIKAPLRRVFRTARRRSGVSSSWSSVALLSAGALVGTGLTVLVAPRLFMKQR
jgi:hypothetical protein